MKNTLLYLSIIITIILLTLVYYKIYEPPTSENVFQFNASTELKDAKTDADIIEYGKKINTEPVLLDKAKLYVRNFVDNTVNCRNPQTPKDSLERSVYFKLDLILKNLADARANLGGQDSDYGFRVYFGRYPITQMCSNSTVGHIPHQYKDLFTNVLVLTKNKLNIEDNVHLNTDTPPTKIRTQFNLGGLCPPDCPTDYSANDPMYKQ